MLPIGGELRACLIFSRLELMMQLYEDVITMSAREIAAAVNTGRLSAIDAVRAHLAIISERNPSLNAIVAIDSGKSLQQARIVDERIGGGECLPLAGVPIIVKDNIWVEDWPITQGSRLFANFIADSDAEAVRLARQAGAVIVGIGACSEFAAKGVTATPLYGTTRHPLAHSLTPGGSSGGNAAALAAGMAPLALGTDAGGSSRRPPAHCGIVGFKPSQDAIPYGPGFAEPFWGVSVIAPMGRTVDDCALLFEALTGNTPAPQRPLRLGYHPTFGIDAAVDADVAAAFEAARRRILAAGVEMDAVTMAWPEGTNEEVLMPLQHAGLAMLYGERWQHEPDLFDPDIGSQIERGLSLPGVAVARALDQSHRLRGCLDHIFAQYDLLIGLTTPCGPWPHDRLGPETIGGKPVSPRDHAALTPRFNHAGLPALSLPCGSDRNGLPVGMQIVGPAGADTFVLAAAAQFETILAGPVA
ncbi:amidase [Phyllobacterium sp. 21LDTY02-6]|uniref:amidase n=1 Tax=unclassified Phyllobacterium TaxID=2638441 RepID=UPI002021BC33|nr:MULTISPECIES: amidase [unclassified Phyllobacterium]MCO4317885.1 amidase [Phyllobacterium sp. 21LDTY02-6]MCX8296240.1 amidase [Phyllobacterium sp. 0TCS1.6A]